LISCINSNDAKNNLAFCPVSPENCSFDFGYLITPTGKPNRLSSLTELFKNGHHKVDDTDEITANTRQIIYMPGRELHQRHSVD